MVICRNSVICYFSYESHKLRVLFFLGFFFFFFFAVLGPRFCARAFSSCGEWGPLFIVVRGPLMLQSTSSRHTSSVVVAHGPSCSVACGTFPDQGLNPCPLHWQADSQPLRHQGSQESTGFERQLFQIFSWQKTKLSSSLLHEDYKLVLKADVYIHQMYFNWKYTQRWSNKRKSVSLFN